MSVQMSCISVLYVSLCQCPFCTPFIVVGLQLIVRSAILYVQSVYICLSLIFVNVIEIFCDWQCYCMLLFGPAVCRSA